MFSPFLKLSVVTPDWTWRTWCSASRRPRTISVRMISSSSAGALLYPPSVELSLDLTVNIKTYLVTCPPPNLQPTSVYIDMGLDNNNPIVLTVVTSGASFTRSFSIKISQIECNSLSKGRTESELWRQKYCLGCVVTLAWCDQSPHSQAGPDHVVCCREKSRRHAALISRPVWPLH